MGVLENYGDDCNDNIETQQPFYSRLHF